MGDIEDIYHQRVMIQSYNRSWNCSRVKA